MTRFDDEEFVKTPLTALQRHVLDDHGTERPGSSALLDEKREGQYLCAKCGKPLFSSETKYDSGSGWPSFWAVNDAATRTNTDNRHAMTRTEVHCATCQGHLGHIFPDGPRPTGLRYCINGASLAFRPKREDDV